MLRLSLILHLFIGASLSGVAIVVVLVAGHGAPAVLFVAALIGFVLGFPLSHVIAKKLIGDG